MNAGIGAIMAINYACLNAWKWLCGHRVAVGAAVGLFLLHRYWHLLV